MTQLKIAVAHRLRTQALDEDDQRVRVSKTLKTTGVSEEDTALPLVKHIRQLLCSLF